MPMHKVLQITDPHLLRPGQMLWGLDPAARLAACVSHIEARHRDALVCVVTGDLADRAEPEAYARLAEILGRLSMPVRLLIGNHDLRGPFRAAFPHAGTDDDGFIQSALETPAGMFLFLDTVEEGELRGRYCARRARWLEARLAEAGERPVFLFMHHPPFEVGHANMDPIRLRDTAHFDKALRAGRNIRHLFAGHIHRPVTGCWRGIPFTIARATSHQVALHGCTARTVLFTHAAPALSAVLIDEDKTVVHFDEFLGEAPVAEARI